MRLILMDNDECYLKQFQLVVSKQYGESIELIVNRDIESLDLMSESLLNQSVLLIHEELIEESLLKLESVNRPLDIFVLSEGVIDDAFMTYLIEHPMIKAGYKSLIIHKYQPTKDLLDNIRKCYLESCKKDRVVGSKDTKLYSVFNPYGSRGYLSAIEAAISKNQSKGKILLIYVDPYEEVTPYGLSYFFTMIKREKTNLNMIISEMVDKVSPQVDVLHGPVNSLDIDCLDEKESNLFIDFLCMSSGYDIVFLIFNGVHISKIVKEILDKSDARILACDQEAVVFRVKSQIPSEWIVASKMDFETVKELINNG